MRDVFDSYWNFCLSLCDPFPFSFIAWRLSRMKRFNCLLFNWVLYWCRSWLFLKWISNTFYTLWLRLRECKMHWCVRDFVRIEAQRIFDVVRTNVFLILNVVSHTNHWYTHWYKDCTNFFFIVDSCASSNVSAVESEKKQREGRERLRVRVNKSSIA